MIKLLSSYIRQWLTFGSKSRIVMTILSRDSADILEKNIEFHLSQGVDFFIVMDHLSIDGTRDMLRPYIEKGVLHYIYQSSEFYNQSKWVTEMARMAKSRFGASWVLNNDADEFWWPETPGQSLKQVLYSLPKQVNVARCRRNNFIYPASYAHSQECFLKLMIYKETQSKNNVGEPLPAKVAHRGCLRVKVGYGNHYVSGFLRKGILDADIEILHFPFRSQKQILDKVRTCGEFIDKAEGLEKNYSTWQKSYKDFQQTQDLDVFLENYTLTKEQLDKKLASGELTKDVRLRDHMDTLLETSKTKH